MLSYKNAFNFVGSLRAEARLLTLLPHKAPVPGKSSALEGCGSMGEFVEKAREAIGESEVRGTYHGNFGAGGGEEAVSRMRSAAGDALGGGKGRQPLLVAKVGGGGGWGG